MAVPNGLQLSRGGKETVEPEERAHRAVGRRNSELLGGPEPVVARVQPVLLPLESYLDAHGSGSSAGRRRPRT